MCVSWPANHAKGLKDAEESERLRVSGVWRENGKRTVELGAPISKSAAAGSEFGAPKLTNVIGPNGSSRSGVWTVFSSEIRHLGLSRSRLRSRSTFRRIGLSTDCLVSVWPLWRRCHQLSVWLGCALVTYLWFELQSRNSTWGQFLLTTDGHRFTRIGTTR